MGADFGLSGGGYVVKEMLDLDFHRLHGVVIEGLDHLCGKRVRKGF